MPDLFDDGDGAVSMSHTPEPWRTSSDGMAIYFHELMVAELQQNSDTHDPISRADAARIVAAVNAVAGITTEELQALGLGGLAKLYADTRRHGA